MQLIKTGAIALATFSAAIAATGAQASSHREAPFISSAPKVDGTDFYMFRSYESGRDGFVTLIANYLPLQDAYGGPNYFSLDPAALYEIHIDNNGDAIEDLTFQFRFQIQDNGVKIPVGGAMVAVPLINVGPISADNTSALNKIETYNLTVVSGDRRTGMRSTITNADNGSSSFVKPVDNIGNKSIPDYPAYAAAHIYNIQVPGCSQTGRVFVGQRQEGFVVNLGETFDLVNIAAPAEALNPNARSLEQNTIADKNVTSMALELPINCVATMEEPVIGAWTTASRRQARMLNGAPQDTSVNGNDGATGTALQGGAWTQVSRLGAPLVNEVVIGLPDKDAFNAAEPKDDGQFATYVTNPTLPELLEILFGSAGVKAPDNFPRNDLIAAFLTGVPGLNQPVDVVGSEMLRLNTSIAATPADSQNDLGVIGGDVAGFPNGRRPVDDVVDIALRASMGVLCTLDGDPFACSDDVTASASFGYTDGALPNPADYDTRFPYLATPLAGSPSTVAAR